MGIDRARLVVEVELRGDVGQVQLTLCDINNKEQVAAAMAGADAAINLVGILYETGGRKFDALHVAGAFNVAEAAAGAPTVWSIRSASAAA